MDIGSISSAISSLKAAGDIAQAMMELKDAQAFQVKAIELNRQILAPQQSAISAQAAEASLLQVF